LMDGRTGWGAESGEVMGTKTDDSDGGDGLRNVAS
jgi:hypothetical protein